MPSASSSGAEPNPKSAKSREHNQGHQGREYTPAQKAAVDRVQKCKSTAYYNILDIKVEATEGEIKKAYRKLALIMHPDKNGAPEADEAFKRVSHAFQVLSDPDKRAHFDRFGGDPDSRGGGGGSEDHPMRGFAGGSPFGFAGTPGRGGPMFEGEISPEDLFNMFFGGGMGPGADWLGDGGGMGGFQTFGGPGIRIRRFGGVPRRRPTRQGGREAQVEQGPMRIIIQLLPLIIFFLLPLLGSLFTGDDSEKLRGPAFNLNRNPPFTEQRETPRYGITFWVNPSDIKDMKGNEKVRLDKRVETSIINALNSLCWQEQEDLVEERNAAQGWIFVDQERLRKANERPLPNCQKLRDLGVKIKTQY